MNFLELKKGCFILKFYTKKYLELACVVAQPLDWVRDTL